MTVVGPLTRLEGNLAQAPRWGSAATVTVLATDLGALIAFAQAVQKAMHDDAERGYDNSALAKVETAVVVLEDAV